MPRICPATEADLPVIQDLAHRIWPVAYASILAPEQLAYMLDRFYSLPALTEQLAAGHRFLLLAAAGIPQGFASFGPLPESGSWKLHKLYVLPEQHGKGLGKALLAAVEQEVLLEQGRILSLNVNRFNPAVHFYHRLGFGTVREEDIAIGGGYFMNDYVLHKPLYEE